MSVKISTTNSKLGLIPSVNLPPILTCRSDAPCFKECYAMRGRFRFPNVRNSMESNYFAYTENPANYFNEIRKAVDNGMVSYAYFRWHASGDIVDEDYFQGMVQLANELPRTSFLCFTKKYEIVNNYIAEHGALPANLNIVLSAWGRLLSVENPYNLPVAYVRFKNMMSITGFIPSDAIECEGNCTHCLRCWNIKSGQSVVFDKH